MDIGLAIEKAIRTLLLTLCQLVYSMIVFFFNIFEKIGTASIVGDSYIMEVYERVGLILGLFMLFRITFTAIQYIINPDLLSDKKSGMGNIVKKAFIVIVLLGTTPYLFQLAFKVQNIIIEEDVLPKILVGSTAETDDFGINLAKYTFFNFYTINPAAGDLCGENQYNAMILDFESSGNLNMTKNCVELYDENKDAWAVNFDYHGLLPLIVGCVLLWMIVMYTLQVAVRMFQLAYLQLIAPVPIMLYLDPKNDEQLKKWFKQCTTTYLDFFIRVAVIYFVVFVIEIIMSEDFFNTIDVTGGTFFSNFYISVVLIIALLVFAKKVPDLFKELFPMGGGAAKFDFGLNPKKVLNDTMAAGLIGGTVGALGAGASNAIHGYMNMSKAWQKNTVDSKLTKEQREALGEKGVADYNARRRAQMAARFGAVAGAAGKAALSVAGGVAGGAKAGIKTKDITKSGEAIKTANKHREERELKAEAGYHWYNPLPTMRDKVLEFSGEAGDTFKNRDQALRDIQKRDSDYKKGAELFATYANSEGKIDVDRAFNNTAYRESFVAVGAAKKETKKAEAALTNVTAELNAAYAMPRVTEEQQVAREKAIALAQERYEKASGDVKAAQGKLEIAKAKHDSYKKIYVNDAKVEDLFKYYDDLTSSEEKEKVLSRGFTSPIQPVTPSPAPSSGDDSSEFEAAHRAYQKKDDEVSDADLELARLMATKPFSPEVEEAKKKFKKAEGDRDAAAERMAEAAPQSTFNSILNSDESKQVHNVDVLKMSKSELQKRRVELENKRRELDKKYRILENKKMNGQIIDTAEFSRIKDELRDLNKILESIYAALNRM